MAMDEIYMKRWQVGWDCLSKEEQDHLTAYYAKLSFHYADFKGSDIVDGYPLYLKPRVEKISGLSLSSVTEEYRREQTCGYWYLIRKGGFASYTAKTSRAELDAWLEMTKLKPSKPIPNEGVPDHMSLEGEFYEVTHSDIGTFNRDSAKALQFIRRLTNGKYTLGFVTEDENGIRFIHELNPNVKSEEFPYWETRNLQDKGNFNAHLTANKFQLYSYLPAFEFMSANGRRKAVPGALPLWSGEKSPPSIGSQVHIRMNAIGKATVGGYAVDEGFLGLIVTLEEQPEWHKRQNDGKNPPSLVFGAEIDWSKS